MNTYSCLILFVLGIGVALPSQAVMAPDWDIQIEKAATYRTVFSSAGPGVWFGDIGKSQIFAVDEPVQVLCRWKYLSKGSKKSFDVWSIKLVVDSAVLDTGTIKNSESPWGTKALLWLPKAPGQYTIQCRSDHADPTPGNNLANTTVTIVPKKPGEQGTFPSPIPMFSSPKAGQVFLRRPTVDVSTSAAFPSVPFGSAPTFGDYAKKMKNTNYPVYCMFELVRTGSGKLSGFETKLKEEKVLLTGKSCSTSFRINDNGFYAVRMYTLQPRDASKGHDPVTGPNSRVNFEVVDHVAEPLFQSQGALPQKNPKPFRVPARPKALGVTKPVFAKPDLAVEHAKVLVAQGCKQQQVVQLDVRTRNKGGGVFPLLTGNHALYVEAGTGLLATGVELPALGPAQSVDKQLALGSAVPPSELAGKTVVLHIQLNKLKWAEETSYLNNVRKIAVSFPKNYCQGRLRPAGPVSPRSPPGETMPRGRVSPQSR